MREWMKKSGAMGGLAEPEGDNAVILKNWFRLALCYFAFEQRLKPGIGEMRSLRAAVLQPLDKITRYAAFV